MSSDIVWKGYAIKDTQKWDQFEVVEFEPKKMGERDVDIRIEYCGVCGSDVHTITGGWGPNIILPMITGHEIVGHVAAVGPKVEEFKVGDRVGVGAIVSSCFDCNRCKQGYENYCKKGKVMTYNSKYPNGDIAHGGYSTAIRADERWVVLIPEEIKLEEAAPLLCAGVTVYSPLFENGAGPGKTVGVVGIGGLGHLAVQFARALGADRIIAFSHSDKKKEDAFAMGATHFVATAEKGWQKEWEDQVNIIINTVDASSAVAIDQLLSTLTVHGKHIMVSLPDDAIPPFKPQSFIANACFFGGSLVGSKKETIDMFKLAVEKNVRPIIQVLPMKEAGKAIHNVKDGSVRYRTVLKADIPGPSKL